MNRIFFLWCTDVWYIANAENSSYQDLAITEVYNYAIPNSRIQISYSVHMRKIDDQKHTV